MSAEVLRTLLTHDYPGNVRELENIIEHAFVLCHGGMIQPAHLPEYLRPAEPAPAAPSVKTLQDLEAHLIYETMQRHGWNRLATAKELGIHKTTLWRKIKQLGLKIPGE